MSKYGARSTVIDGIRFDSQAEAQRYTELKLLERAGEISNLVVHPRFVVWSYRDPESCKVEKIEYVADFYYVEDCKGVVEDVKGVLTPVYRLKKKMFLALFPEYDFIELKAS